MLTFGCVPHRLKYIFFIYQAVIEGNCGWANKKLDSTGLHWDFSTESLHLELMASSIMHHCHSLHFHVHWWRWFSLPFCCLAPNGSPDREASKKFFWARTATQWRDEICTGTIKGKPRSRSGKSPLLIYLSPYLINILSLLCIIYWILLAINTALALTSWVLAHLFWLRMLCMQIPSEVAHGLPSPSVNIYMIIKAWMPHKYKCNPRARSNKDSGKVMQMGIIKTRGSWEGDRDERMRRQMGGATVIEGVVFYRMIKVKLKNKERRDAGTHRLPYMLQN